MHGLTGGGWKRSVGHGHRSEAARRGNPGKSGCGTYRRVTSPRQPPTLHQVRDACHDAERRFGLQLTAPADRTSARRATRAETEQAARRGWAEPARVTLRREVCTAAAGAATEQEFFTRLRQAGVLVHERRSRIRPDQVTGYAVGLPGHTARGCGVVWYGGGRLAAGLTLPRLRDRWHQRTAPPAERPGTPRFTRPERDEIYRHAARQARAATEHIRRCSVSDPAAAADAAWAAADTLHAAARVLRNPHLRCAADSYDRAARAAYGRIPARSHDGDQLRRTARLIALAGNLTGDTTLMAIALMGQLVALAAAVAELRQAQQYAAQAAAARAAAAHLHSAVTQARARVPHFGHAHAPRPDKTTSATHVVRRDFPAGWKPTQPVVDGENPQRSYSPLSKDVSRPKEPARVAAGATDSEIRGGEPEKRLPHLSPIPGGWPAS